VRLHQRFPAYGFDRHKGYPTPDHLEALRRVGPCAVHRGSFGPVREMLLARSAPLQVALFDDVDR
jgi:ribonuclease HII